MDGWMDFSPSIPPPPPNQVQNSIHKHYQHSATPSVTEIGLDSGLCPQENTRAGGVDLIDGWVDGGSTIHPTTSTQPSSEQYHHHRYMAPSAIEVGFDSVVPPTHNRNYKKIINASAAPSIVEIAIFISTQLWIPLFVIHQ